MIFDKRLHWRQGYYSRTKIVPRKQFPEKGFEMKGNAAGKMNGKNPGFGILKYIPLYKIIET